MRDASGVSSDRSSDFFQIPRLHGLPRGLDRRAVRSAGPASRLLINSAGSLQGMQACFQVLALDDPPSTLQQIRQALTLLGGDHTSAYRLQNPVQLHSQLSYRADMGNLQPNPRFFAEWQHPFYAQSHGRGIALQGHR